MPKSNRVCFICSKRAVENGPISLHCIPKSETMCAKWMSILGLQPEIDNISSVRVCSRHFEDKFKSVFRTAQNIACRLVSKAYPTLHLENLDEESNGTSISPPSDLKSENQTLIVIEDDSEQCLIEDSPMDTTAMSQTQVGELPVEIVEIEEVDEKVGKETTPKRRWFEPRYVGDVRSPDVETPRKARRVLQMFRNELSKKNQKIKSLHNSIIHLRKKLLYGVTAK